MRIELLRGPHDGRLVDVPDHLRELRLPRVVDVAIVEHTDPSALVAYVVDVYAPATAADALTRRWSLIRSEQP